MGFDPFSRVSNSQRTTRFVLLAIILLTLPCYCLGAVLLASAPDKATRSPGAMVTAGWARAVPVPLDHRFRTLYLQLQEQISAENRQFSTLSNVLKARHDTVKNAIGNIR